MNHLFKVTVTIKNNWNHNNKQVPVYVWAYNNIDAYSEAKRILLESGVIYSTSQIIKFNSIPTTLEDL